MSLFHEQWWLNAVAGSAWEEVTVCEDGDVIGRLPFFCWRWMGCRVIGMPPLTRTLGPLVMPGTGKPHTNRQRASRIVRTLIDKLPPHVFFKQVLPPSTTDALPFQFKGYSLSCEHVFELDTLVGVSRLWNNLPTRTRTMIRRVKGEYRVRECLDIDEFYGAFKRNIDARGGRIHFDQQLVRSIYEACRSNRSGAVLALYDRSGTMVAGIFLAWAGNRMHFLLQTRSADSLNGAIETLIWEAVERASQAGMILDLDGLPNETLARRMSQFGGDLRQRTVVVHGACFLPAMRLLRRDLHRRFRDHSAFI